MFKKIVFIVAFTAAGLMNTAAHAALLVYNFSGENFVGDFAGAVSGVSISGSFTADDGGDGFIDMGDITFFEVAVTGFANPLLNISFDSTSSAVSYLSSRDFAQEVSPGVSFGLLDISNDDTFDFLQLDLGLAAPDFGITFFPVDDPAFDAYRSTGLTINDQYFSVVPVPAAFPLLFSALGMLGLIGRRQKRAVA